MAEPADIAWQKINAMLSAYWANYIFIQYRMIVARATRNTGAHRLLVTYMHESVNVPLSILYNLTLGIEPPETNVLEDALDTLSRMLDLLQLRLSARPRSREVIQAVVASSELKDLEQSKDPIEQALFVLIVALNRVFDYFFLVNQVVSTNPRPDAPRNLKRAFLQPIQDALIDLSVDVSTSDTVDSLRALYAAVYAVSRFTNFINAPMLQIATTNAARQTQALIVYLNRTDRLQDLRTLRLQQQRQRQQQQQQQQQQSSTSSTSSTKK